MPPPPAPRGFWNLRTKEQKPGRKVLPHADGWPARVCFTGILWPSVQWTCTGLHLSAGKEISCKFSCLNLFWFFFFLFPIL